ncbi:hypothetical protein GCM10011401_16650 [Nesterenkonia cremea]|uniref:Uncharacterized protein n=2 Tax=Nesterenkonia cremea TaxID=1882340 RepID=A0A917ERE0_9MICC|nr:hypothetical protein GCM10011401_16650 [Nesterenkonia cremea]
MGLLVLTGCGPSESRTERSLERDHQLTDVTIVVGDVHDSSAPSLTADGGRSFELETLTEDTWGDMVALLLEEEPASASLVTGDHGLAMNVQLGSSRADAADLEAFRSWQSHETPAGLQNIGLSLEGQVLFYPEGGVITDVSEDEDSVTVLLSATAGESEEGLERLSRWPRRPLKAISQAR